MSDERLWTEPFECGTDVVIVMVVVSIIVYCTVFNLYYYRSFSPLLYLTYTHSHKIDPPEEKKSPHKMVFWGAVVFV